MLVCSTVVEVQRGMRFKSVATWVVIVFDSLSLEMFYQDLLLLITWVMPWICSSNVITASFMLIGHSS